MLDTPCQWSGLKPLNFAFFAFSRSFSSQVSDTLGNFISSGFPVPSAPLPSRAYRLILRHALLPLSRLL